MSRGARLGIAAALVVGLALAGAALGSDGFYDFVRTVELLGLPYALIAHTPLGWLPRLGFRSAGAELGAWAGLLTGTGLLAWCLLWLISSRERPPRTS